MHHQGGFDIVERSPLEHQDLSTPTLFGWRPEDAYLPVHLGCNGCSSQSGTKACCGDDVVATGVADSG